MRERDIVFDVYRPSSLKAEAKSKRGAWSQVHSNKQIQSLSSWRNLLRNNDNKTDLFNFLADKIELNMVIVTKEKNALSHEEADTRIFVHAAQEGNTSLLVKASDTDILVTIAISVMPILQAIGLQLLWIALGQGRVESCA